MMISAKLLASVAVVTLITVNISFAAEPAAPNAGKAEIGFTADTAYPESVTWSAKQGKFFVSSVRHGAVGTVTPDGKYTPFIADDKLVNGSPLGCDEGPSILRAQRGTALLPPWPGRSSVAVLGVASLGVATPRWHGRGSSLVSNLSHRQLGMVLLRHHLFFPSS